MSFHKIAKQPEMTVLLLMYKWTIGVILVDVITRPVEWDWTR